MKPTNDQQQAIDFEGNNLLVSAGAGSGKTQVLSQRVIRKLLEGRQIDSFVILTFTRAAAEGMKSRIKKEMEKHDELIPQIPLLDNAMISTFDSFCLRVVKQYSYLLNIDSEIQISDEIEINFAKEDALKELIFQVYEEKSPRFLHVLETLFNKGDHLFFDGLKDFVAKLEYIPMPNQYLDEYESHFFSEQMVNKLEEDFVLYMQRQLDSLITEFAAFSIQFPYPMLESYFASIDSTLQEFKSISFDDLIEKTSSYKYPRKPSIKEDQELNDTFKEAHERFKKHMMEYTRIFDKYFIHSKADLKKQIFAQQEVILLLVQHAKKYLIIKDRIYKERHLFDYPSIMNAAILLFENHPDIQQDFKTRICEIMIDEYQDTNDFQEYLMGMLSHNNLFMVGDMKQSIYRFRHANPSNFAYKFIEYSNHHQGELVVLDYNFRSRKEVLSFINHVFNKVMDERIGGINYQNRQALQYGQKQYDQVTTTSYQPVILTYEQDDLGNDSADSYEAKAIFEDILKRITQHEQILDENGYRDIDFKDFTILTDRKTTFDLYESIAKEKNIPFQKISDESFTSNTEILALIQLINVVYLWGNLQNEQNEFLTSIYGFLRSFIIQSDDQTIIDLLLEVRKSSFSYQEVLLHHEVFKEVFIQIQSLYEYQNYHSLYDVLSEIIRKFNFYEKLLLLDHPRERLDRIHHFIITISAKNMFTLNDLYLYLKRLSDASELDITFQSDMDLNANKVKMMTIHKSKGLEFNVCYYSGLHKRFNFQEERKWIQFHTEYGLFTKVFEEGYYDSFIKILATQNEREQMISERIRLFYVALTRAKQKMVFLLNLSKLRTTPSYLGKDGLVLAEERIRMKSFADLFSMISLDQYYESIHLSNLINVKQNATDSNIEFHSTQLSFQPIQPDTHHYSKSTLKLMNQEEKEKMEYGTKIHQLFELFDFHDIDSSINNIPESYRPMISQFIASFPSELFNHQSDIYQEYEFYDGSRYGIIDLLIVKQDVAYIIDYKLKDITDEQYQIQIGNYMKYIRHLLQIDVKGYLYSILTGQKKEIYDEQYEQI